MNAKQEVIDLLARLPDDCTLEDIQYHLYARQKVAHGLQAAEEGRVVSHEEAQKRFARWLRPS